MFTKEAFFEKGGNSGSKDERKEKNLMNRGGSVWI